MEIEEDKDSSIKSTSYDTDLIEVMEVLYNSNYLTFYEFICISFVNKSLRSMCYKSFGDPNLCIKNSWPYKSDFMQYHPNPIHGTMFSSSQRDNNRFGMKRYHEILKMELKLLDLAMSYNHSLEWEWDINPADTEPSSLRKEISNRNLIGIIPNKNNSNNSKVKFGKSVTDIINEDFNADLLYCVLETFHFIETFDLVKEEVVTEKTRKNPIAQTKRPKTPFVTNSIFLTNIC